MSLLIYTFLLIYLSQPTLTYSWGLFSSTSASTEPHSTSNPSKNSPISENFVAEFTMEAIINSKGLKEVEKANQKLEVVGPNSCWHNAYVNLFAGCSEIVADKEKQSRHAWHLGDCFQRDSGRSFPSCNKSSPMKKCLESLDENMHNVYLKFFLETNSICHQLQADAFKHETERVVNDLKQSAKFAEDKLENIEEVSEQLLENSNQIHNLLSSIDFQIEQVEQTSKEVGEHIDVVLNYSNNIFEQSKNILVSQSELHGGQTRMREKLEQGITMVEESYKNLGQDIEKLRGEALVIEAQITEVSISMSLKMNNLQNKAVDIGNIVGFSLEKQKQLLDGQSTALEGLDNLTEFQSQALEESRLNLQALVEFGQNQQEELLRQQEDLKRAHDYLVENSTMILEAQEEFKKKQESMFLDLDKLFTLYKVILRESRSIKLLIYYSFFTFILYIATSAKQTYNVRAHLILGLWATFLIEFGFRDDLDQQTLITKLARSCFAVLACIQIVFSFATYREYEVVNYTMLQTLIEKVNTMGKQKYFEEEENDINLVWLINSELPEEDVCQDPDYILHEEVAENSVVRCSPTRKYNLRPRLR